MPYHRKGMGQTTPAYSGSGPCQFPLAGIAPQPGIPICPSTGFVPNASQTATSGSPGYEANSPGAFGPTYAANQAAALVASALAQTSPATPSPATPSQSNAPAASVVTPAATNSTGTIPVQSNAPSSTTVTPVVATPASSCFALFGNEPCIGPIGLYTLLAAGGGAVLLMMMLGGHR